MRDSRINFRSPELAGLLAFLIPGAGHFYQGRRLKAGIYFTCILSLFFGGMILGDWQPVYYLSASQPMEMLTQEQTGRLVFDKWQLRRRLVPTIGYPAQFFTGLVAMPALVQHHRLKSDPGVVGSLTEAISSDFVGGVQTDERFIPVSGHLDISRGAVGSAVGRFDGETRGGEEISREIDGTITLGRAVYGSPRRTISISGMHGFELDGRMVRRLDGTVSRSFLDWYQAPRDNKELDRLHGKLSQHFDIACVFTWIAGLLNLMAIWDAYEGPAYGYGDEKPDEDDEDDSDDKARKKQSR